LPNFTVGRILLDTDPAMLANRGPFHQRLAGETVSPLGISIPAEYNALYRQFRGRFGHAAQMRCPHYLADSGRCGIWRQRTSVCATWFCKYVRGSVGDRFWTSLLQLLRNVEYQLSFWCVNQLNPGDDSLARLFAYRAARSSTEDDSPDIIRNSRRYRTLWGRWLNREREFFEECGKLVTPLTWQQVLDIGGQDTALFARTAVIAYQNLLDERLPAAVRMGTLQVTAMGPDRIRLIGYHPMDPIELPRELFAALGHFDGQPIGQAIQAIEDQNGLYLDEDLVRGLVDFRILEPVIES
jgi:hypothetical protein